MLIKISQSLIKGVRRFSLTGLVLPAMLLFCQGRAEAILNYYIFEDGGNPKNLKIVTTGSLRLSSLDSSAGSNCNKRTTNNSPGGTLIPGSAIICSGVETSSTEPYKKYVISDSTSFTDGSGSFLAANSITGTRNWLFGSDTPTPSFYIIDPYIDGPSIDSSANFNGTSLSNVGLNGITGSNGSWTFFNDTNPTNVINVIVGAPPVQLGRPPCRCSAPPLPSAGAAACAAALARPASAELRPSLPLQALPLAGLFFASVA